MKYTPEQKNIFDFIKNGLGHGIIDAVAGAGKTTTIMECARYVADKSEILFCAFNKSIADEIASKFVQRKMNAVTTKTMHSLGRQILHDNNSTGKPIKLQESKYIQLMKHSEIQELILPHLVKIVRYNGLEYDTSSDRQAYEVENLVRRFSWKILEINTKFRLTLCDDSYQDFRKMIIHYGIFKKIEIEKRDFDKELESYLECHRILLERANLFSKKTMIIDFADMLYLPFIWKQYPIRKYGFLFIDECQDLSISQFCRRPKTIYLRFYWSGHKIFS
jgi:superfamily I DNA/RNA helicase